MITGIPGTSGGWSIASDVRPDHDKNLESDEELAAYADLGSVGAETVVRRMDEALRANRLRAGVIVPAPGTDVGGSGARLDHVADVVAGIRLFGAGALPDQQSFLESLRRDSPGVVTEVMLHPPMIPGMPVITASFDYEDEHFLRDYADAMAAGLDWACVYHYGLLDPERFARTMALLGVERN